MKKNKKIILFVVLILMVMALVILVCNANLKLKIGKKIGMMNGKIDDWEYSGQSSYNDGTVMSGIFKSANSFSSNAGISPSSISPSFDAAESSTIGFSVGGAKDVENFRENIKNGYFPISTDITYNGLFYDYTFNTGKKAESKDLFSPSYSTAISKDPISLKDEYYMTVGLNSNIKESDFQRKKLNLVVVLDISGSMSSGFDTYYYDTFNKKDIEINKDSSKTKMQIANESVNILIDQLNDDDRFGMVLFDDSAYIGKPISLVGETNIDAIKEHILEIGAMGGTNFEAGYTEATKLFEEYKNINSNEYENRIIVITDAMPNYGTTSKDGLMSYVQDNAKEGIYTTFIGVGVDFNTELIETISDVKGANYYSVHSAKEFKEQMGEQFEYMVTPLVFDLKLNLESTRYEIDGVYGSDTVNTLTGDIINVNTLFPSTTTDDGEVKGGVILLKLKKLENTKSNEIKLHVEYKDREGKQYSNEQNVSFEGNKEYYENNGIRKAIALTRYANVLKNWILYERFESPRFIINDVYGIKDCDCLDDEQVYRMLGEHERTSVKLSVSDEYREVFSEFKEYIQKELQEIKDSTMKQEVEILDLLIKTK